MSQLGAYAHFVALVSIVGSLFYLWWQHRDNQRLAGWQVAATLLLVVWLVLNLAREASNVTYVVLFLLSAQTLVLPLLCAISWLGLYIRTYTALPPVRWQLVVLLFFLPLFLFLPTSLGLVAIERSTCSVAAGPITTYYATALGMAFVWLMFQNHFRDFSTRACKDRWVLFFSAIAWPAFLTLMLLATMLYHLTGSSAVLYYLLISAPFFAAAFLVNNNQDDQSANNRNIHLLVIGTLATFLCLLLFASSELQTPIIITSLLLLSLLAYHYTTLVRALQHKQQSSANHTKRRQTASKRVRQLEQTQTELITILSNQLRSPLASIASQASLLADGSYGRLPKQGQAVAVEISETAESVADSMKHYLSAAELETGCVQYKLTDFNLKEEVSDVVDSVRQKAVHRGLLLTFRSRITSQAIVHADLAKIRDVVMILIDNALTYTPQGSIKVTVHDDPAQKQICVTVADTGVGLSTQEQELVFDKFKRGAGAAGTTSAGLGLFVARSIARDQDGEITVHSDGTGKGGSFTLTLPLQM